MFFKSVVPFSIESRVGQLRGRYTFQPFTAPTKAPTTKTIEPENAARPRDKHYR